MPCAAILLTLAAFSFAAPGKPVCPTAAPPPAERRALESILLAAVIDTGTAAGARDKALAILRRMTGALPEDVLRKLVAARVTLVLVPAGRRVLDLPEASAARAEIEGTTTLDGRPWAEVDSFSNVPLPCGQMGWFVSESALPGAPGRGNRKGYAVVHEFAHMVEKHGLPPAVVAELRRLRDAYYAVSAIERPLGPDLYYPYPDTYAILSDEFFPQMTNVWLDAYQIGPGGGDRLNAHRSPAWLDYVPSWLPAGPAFTARDRYLRKDFSGSLDEILGRSRRHERLSALLRAVWGERRSVLAD